jgi:phenylalanyl-tRNA synthetase alpha subunit
MVNPHILEKAGIDPEEYSGFDVGIGVKYFAMASKQMQSHSIER